MASPMQPAELARFLELYSQHYNFSRAAREIGRNRRSLERYAERDEDFREAIAEIEGRMIDNLVAEAYRRAHDGVDKPVFQGGELVGYIREYSDSVLLKMLTSLSTKFRERTQLDVSNSDGSLTSGASDAQIAARVASILAVAQARKARGEIIDAEIVEPAKLPAPSNEDLL